MAARLPDKPKDYSGYARFFSHTSFRKKLKRTASKAGRKVVYAALVLYYAATDKSIPLRQRAKIYGALGYFILPIDLIPDFTAILGYTDDLGALLWALKSIADNITPEICAKAAERLMLWFPDAGETPPELPMLNNEDKTGLPGKGYQDPPEG